jgi:hypothetical protein
MTKEMITIAEFSPTVYFIKCDNEITSEEMMQIPEVTEIIGSKLFELKLGDHGIWILKFT